MDDDYGISKPKTTNDTRPSTQPSTVRSFISSFWRTRNETNSDEQQSSCNNNKKSEKSMFQIIREKVERHFMKPQPIEVDIEAKLYHAHQEVMQQMKQLALPMDSSYERYCARMLIAQTGPASLIMELAQSDMMSHAWYWGKISRFEAQRQLAGKPNGSFLIRDSESNGPQFTLSFRIGNCTLHYRIVFNDLYWRFESRKYISIVDLVEDIMHRSTEEKFICYVKVPCELQPPYPVILKYPVSRYANIASLQEFCRRQIKKCIKPCDIKHLPIPKVLKLYLAEECPFSF